LLKEIFRFFAQRHERFLTMTAELTAIVKRDGDWWIGWIEEIPGANAQERSKEELLISLRAAAQDIVAIHREVALRQADRDFEEILLAI
jgi:predicted RNase H-like HicB family nuclease